MICSHYLVIGFILTTTQRKNCSSAIKGIGGISPVRKEYNRIQIKKLITDDILTDVATTYTKQVFFGTPSGSRGFIVNAVSLYPPYREGRLSA